ncbi:MAG: hypothetical protein HOD72_01855 [Opitutae bacterium]|nr:hypothetical protein [Opitutae bacterium]MBT5379569.1 hypothetical protein [Opitutae bacterium]
MPCSFAVYVGHNRTYPVLVDPVLDVSLGNSSAVMFHGILGTFNPGGESPFPPSHDQEHIEE